MGRTEWALWRALSRRRARQCFASRELLVKPPSIQQSFSSPPCFLGRNCVARKGILWSRGFCSAPEAPVAGEVVKKRRVSKVANKEQNVANKLVASAGAVVSGGSSEKKPGTTRSRSRKKVEVPADGEKPMANSVVGEQTMAVPVDGEKPMQFPVDSEKPVHAQQPMTRKRSSRKKVEAALEANNENGEKGRGKKRSNQPEKLELGKYFQAVGEEGDIFREEESEVEEKKLDVAAVPDILTEKFSDPARVFQRMLESNPQELTSEEKSGLRDMLMRFAERGWAQNQALALYINSKVFPVAASRFRKFFTSKCPPELREVLLKVGPCDEAEEYLFPIFAELCIHEFASEITRYRELVNSADLTKPHAWFPFARAMKRKVIYHCGPTNSGKTYTALQRFLQAETGIYCCPLRLLAMEIYEKSNNAGVYCSLHTGQERREVPFSTHLACTVEMAVLNKPWAVAVIDEIQMAADEFRGWAWTKAFLAIQADEVHLCGDPSTLKLFKGLCVATGDDFIEHHYERFRPLTIDQESVKGDFNNVEEGDCIVAFSRKEIFQVKLEIEQKTKHKCCVVYGALPPETRTQQAKLFNDPGSGYNVLVASDAIGMGLNLNIRRIIFSCLDKFNGEQRIPVPASQVKQIAGRAGRRGSLYPEGRVTTLYASDIPYLVECMKQPFEDASSAGLFPVYEQMELFASQLPDITFGQLLDRFSETCRLDGTYFLCKNDNLKKVASLLDKIEGLSLEDRFNFCFAPVNSRDPKSMGTLQRFAAAYSKKVPVRLSMGIPKKSATDNAGIYDLETRHQLLSMYLWLSQHFSPLAFPEKTQAADMASKIAVMLGESLALFTGEEAKKRQQEQMQQQQQQEQMQQQQQQPKVGMPTAMSMRMQAMRQQLCAA